MGSEYWPGTYDLEIRAWADNNVDTGSSIGLQVTILDPCDTTNGGGSITILPAIISPNPVLYKIYDPMIELDFISKDGVTVTQEETAAICTPIEFSITDINDSATLDSLFTY